MTDSIESAISKLTEHYLNHSDELFAAQVVSIAIQLSQSIEPNDIYPKIDLAFKLIENAKKKINTIKMEAKRNH